MIRYAALAIGVLLALFLVASASAQQGAPSEDAVRRVARQLQCPVCEGQTVADSNSGLAQDMRNVIRDRLAAGQNDQQILDSFVASYGDGILSEPPKRGLGLGVWVGPVIGLLVGAAVVGLLARKWTRRTITTSPANGTSEDAKVSEELRQFREQYG